jgi:hypothetical protein
MEISSLPPRQSVLVVLSHPLLDHIIMIADGYLSFIDDGYLIIKGA